MDCRISARPKRLALAKDFIGEGHGPIPPNDSDAASATPTPRNTSLGLRTLYTYYFARSITQFSNTPHPPLFFCLSPQASVIEHPPSWDPLTPPEIPCNIMRTRVCSSFPAFGVGLSRSLSPPLVDSPPPIFLTFSRRTPGALLIIGLALPLLCYAL